MSTAAMDKEEACKIDGCEYKTNVMMKYNRHCATHVVEYEEMMEPLPDILASYHNGRISIRYELSEFCFSYCTGNNLGFVERCLKREMLRKDWSTTATAGYYEREAYRLEINKGIWCDMDVVLSLCSTKVSAEICEKWHEYVQTNVAKTVDNEEMKRLMLRRNGVDMRFENRDMLCYMVASGERKPSPLYVGTCDGDVGNRLLTHRYCYLSEGRDIVNGIGMRACVVARIEFKDRSSKDLDREMIELVEELTRRFFKEKGKINVRNKERRVANCDCSFCVSHLRNLFF